MEIFQLDDCSERFWYAAETQEQVIAMHRDLFECECEALTITELSEDEQKTVLINYEMEEGEEKITLNEVYQRDRSKFTDLTVLQLASTCY